MNKRLDKLEGLRGFAAFYVFLGHLLLGRLHVKESALGFAFRFGQEAVMLFFLLSGFVIYYAHSKQNDRSFRAYFIKRAKRIYPIFILALLVAYLSKVASTHSWSMEWRALLGNLMMLQDFTGGKPGVMVDTFCGNLPLWSLSYEWWFYMMFWPIITYVRVSRQKYLVAGISATGGVIYLMHPNQISLFLLYFIIWWSGVELARTYCNRQLPTFQSQKESVFLLGCFCAIGFFLVLFTLPNKQLLQFGVHPILELRHFSSSFVFLVIGIGWAAINFRGFEVITLCFRWLAPISYGIYALHYPLAVSATYLSFIANKELEVLGYVLCVLALSYWSEILGQRFVNR